MLSEDAVSGPVSLEGFAFGRHVRRVREARGMTVAELGDAARLSVETIEEIEAGSSPSYSALCRLAAGLDMALSTLFETFEQQDATELRELVALLRGRGPEIIGAVITLARALVGAVDKIASAANGSGERD